jgi:hypothetical protein
MAYPNICFLSPRQTNTPNKKLGRPAVSNIFYGVAISFYQHAKTCKNRANSLKNGYVIYVRQLYDLLRLRCLNDFITFHFTYEIIYIKGVNV